jgi:glycosyltransferase involved in cell wall biosynthesis
VERITLNFEGISGNLLAATRNNILRIRSLRQVLQQTRPDVAIGMMSTASVLLAIARLCNSDCAIIASERSYPPMVPLGRMWQNLRRWTYPLTDRVVMLTSEGQDWLKKEIPSAHGVMIPNPISYPLATFEPRLPTHSVIRSDRKLLLAVGRLSDEKRFDLLLTIFSTLAPTNTDWDLVILGEGTLRSRLEALVQSLGLNGRAFLPGRVGNVADWYMRADLYVMTSRFEGFPNTLSEAMAHGCAVMSFDCDTGPRELIRHQDNGLLVAANDADGFKEMLKMMMANEALRLQYASRAIDVRERYSLVRVVSMWERLFKEITK